MVLCGKLLTPLLGGSKGVLCKGGEGGHVFLGKTSKSVYMNVLKGGGVKFGRFGGTIRYRGYLIDLGVKVSFFVYFVCF